jgi:hypothetical protein
MNNMSIKTILEQKAQDIGKIEKKIDIYRHKIIQCQIMIEGLRKD